MLKAFGATDDHWIVVKSRRPKAVKLGLIVILALGAGGLVLAWNEPEARKTAIVPGKSGAASPMVQDALVLVGAGQSAAYQRAVAGLLGFLTRAGRLARPAGTALVWRKAPALVRAVDDEQSLLYGRVRAVELQTSRSELCRQVALRLVARTQGAVRELEIELAQSSPAWDAVEQFNTAREEVVRSYLSELGPCIAAAPKRDRTQLARIMLRF